MKVAVIPARGGSKRIPRKNIKSFAGRPIISYSIEQALRCALFDRILVSTDDDEIAEVARRCGAETPFLRPRELADDFSGTNDVVKHALRWLKEHGEEATHACCIYATAPFLQAEFLTQGYLELVQSDRSYAFSVTTFPFPVQRALRITAQGRVDAMDRSHIFTRSQDLEEAYHDAGQFYWGTAHAFLSDTVIFSAASIPIILPRHLVQDIDTPEDWERAELMFQAWKLASVTP